jgi:hypothetical protein
LTQDADVFTDVDRSLWYDLIEELCERYTAGKTGEGSTSEGDRSNSEGDRGKTAGDGSNSVGDAGKTGWRRGLHASAPEQCTTRPWQCCQSP